MGRDATRPAGHDGSGLIVSDRFESKPGPHHSVCLRYLSILSLGDCLCRQGAGQVGSIRPECSTGIVRVPTSTKKEKDSF